MNGKSGKSCQRQPHRFSNLLLHVRQKIAIQSEGFHAFIMQPKTEELLNFLLWTADKLTRPTFRNLTDSYESWVYRNGLPRQVATLEKQQMLERDPTSWDDRLYRLTELGRVHALGGRDPQVQWTRHWDGRWRLVLFDVPRKQNARRDRLRRYLRSRAFGCLQGSVWITPDSVHNERETLAEGQVSVETLLLLEARPRRGRVTRRLWQGLGTSYKSTATTLATWNSSIVVRRGS
jgi:hypothetical protein